MPTFSAAVDVTRFTPSIPSTASSTRRVMPSSTSAGVAPGNGTVTFTTPGEMVGNTWDCSRDADSAPPTSRTTISRLAATGLWTNHPIRPDRCLSGEPPRPGLPGATGHTAG